LSENLFKNSNSLKTRKTHVLPRPQHRERCTRERQRKRVMCVTRHTKTRVSVVAVKRWRASESQPTKNKLESKKKKKKHTKQIWKWAAKLQTPSSRRDLGGNKISARKKKYKDSRTPQSKKRGRVGSQRREPEETIAVAKSNGPPDWGSPRAQGLKPQCLSCEWAREASVSFGGL
jgi:hypothetical protein